MQPLTFKQFEIVLVDAEVTKENLFDAVRPEIYSFRQSVFSKLSAEEGFKEIFDRADATSGTKRRKNRTSAGSNENTPNTDRVERLTKAKGYQGARRPVEAVFFHFLVGEDDQSYADAIARTLFGAPFFEHFEDKLRKMGVEIPGQRSNLDTFFFGNIALRLSHDPGARPLSFPKQDVDALFEDGNLLPLEALRWQNAVSNSYGRGDQVAEIHNWAEEPDKRVKVRLIHGPGGVGKTRLAADAAAQLKKKGWEVGFLPTDIRASNAEVILQGGGVGTVLVIDYPEERPDLVQSVFQAIADDQQLRVPVRILFVSRETEEAWRNSTNTHIKRFSVTPLKLYGALEVDNAFDLIESAVVFLTSQLSSQEIDLAPARVWLEESAQNRIPLFALASAVHALTSSDQAFALSGQELIEALVKIELSRIRRYSQRDLAISDHQDNKLVLEKLLALGLLSGEGVSKQALYALGEKEIAPGAKGHDLLVRVARTPYWKHDAGHTEGGFLDKIEPDIVGAELFRQAFLKHPVPFELPAWMACTSREAEDRFLSVLGRLCFDLALTNPGDSLVLEKAASDMFDDAPDLAEGFLNLHWRDMSVFSASFSAKFLRLRLVVETRESLRAGIANNLAIVLSDLGRHDEAHLVAQEALDLSIKLSEAKPISYLPDLAMSLNTLGSTMYRLGRRDEALEATQQAVDQYRKLSETQPDEFLPALALSMSNLGNMAADLGRREEALEATQEAVNWHRTLSKTRPDEFLPGLAASLNNLAISLSALELRKEALSAAQESVVLRRNLSEAQPHVFLPYLGTSLNNLAIMLSCLERPEEALLAAREAVDTLSRFSEAHPRSFASDLAMSMNSLANILAELGRPEEAIAAAQEAVDRYRAISQTKPDVFLPNLAMSLHNLSTTLSNLERPDEAIFAAHDAVSALSQSFLAYPNAFKHNMADLSANYMELCLKEPMKLDMNLMVPISEMFDRLKRGEI